MVKIERTGWREGTDRKIINKKAKLIIHLRYVERKQIKRKRRKQITLIKEKTKISIRNGEKPFFSKVLNILNNANFAKKKWTKKSKVELNVPEIFCFSKNPNETVEFLRELDKFIERIFDFFNSCNFLTDKLRETNESNVKLNWVHDTYSKKIKANVVVPFTKEYTGLQQELVLSAEIIDDSLAESIQAAFQNFQDEFLRYTESTNPDYNKCKLMIADSQKNIISILKVYNNNIYD